MMVDEMKQHLKEVIIPFWKSMKDEECGGFYGYLDYDLNLDKKAVKGCILNSRITWFFSQAYLVLKEIGELDESLLAMANHGFSFMEQYCMDQEFGGIYWSMNFDGSPNETIKHTYNQAFSIYALSAFYEATGNQKALKMAMELFEIIETKCRDEEGYLESFDREFKLIDNEKLSENGVIAYRTMNTLLHVFEAYTELFKVTQEEKVKEKLLWMMDVFADKMYNPILHRQEVFFDKEYHSLIDLHSYGHDIETAWLIDRGVEVVGLKNYEAKMTPITADLTREIFEVAFNGDSLHNECENGHVNTSRIWWVQAESVVGFLNGYQKDQDRVEYMAAAKKQWNYIKEFMIDTRKGSEWYWEVDMNGQPTSKKPIVEPWKCPYHNGRMCLEVIRRAKYVK